MVLRTPILPTPSSAVHFACLLMKIICVLVGRCASVDALGRERLGRREPAARHDLAVLLPNVAVLLGAAALVALAAVDQEDRQESRVVVGHEVREERRNRPRERGTHLERVANITPC